MQSDLKAVGYPAAAVERRVAMDELTSRVVAVCGNIASRAAATCFGVVKVEDITGKELLNFFVVSEDLKDDRSLAYAIRDAIEKKMSVFDTVNHSMLDIDYFGEQRDIA
jgi:hypothetical protein